MFISISEFEERVKSDFSHFKLFDKKVEIVEHTLYKFKFRIYTFTNVYSVVVVIHRDPNCNNYLGCTASSRKPRAGEDWTRGNDLSDGPFTEEIWNNIKNDIINYELVNIHKAQIPPEDKPPIVGPSIEETKEKNPT